MKEDGGEVVAFTWSKGVGMGDDGEQGCADGRSSKAKSDFDLVCKHYGCTADEITEMREIANRDQQVSAGVFRISGKKIRVSDGLPRRKKNMGAPRTKAPPA